MELTPRQRVWEAIRRGKPDRVPKEVWLTPPVEELVRERTGMGPLEFFDVETRSVDVDPPEHPGDFSRYLRDMPEGAVIDSEYGTASVAGSFHHFRRRVFPMANLSRVAEVEQYPWPDLHSADRYASVESRTKALHDAGYFVDGSVGHIFETAWQLTGFEKLMESMVVSPDFAAAVIDPIAENNIVKARRFAEAGVDMIRIADDIAMQDRMMMNPDLWREWFKARHAKAVRAAREVNPDIAVWYHSDGNVEPVIEDLIEIGINVLNPVQPECMDVREIKRKYGDRLAFWGTIGTQSVMPFGTPDDVRRNVREMIDLFASVRGPIAFSPHV